MALCIGFERKLKIPNIGFYAEREVQSVCRQDFMILFATSSTQLTKIMPKLSQQSELNQDMQINPEPKIKSFVKTIFLISFQREKESNKKSLNDDNSNCHVIIEGRVLSMAPQKTPASCLLLCTWPSPTCFSQGFSSSSMPPPTKITLSYKKFALKYNIMQKCFASPTPFFKKLFSQLHINTDICHLVLSGPFSYGRQRSLGHLDNSCYMSQLTKSK